MLIPTKWAWKMVSIRDNSFRTVFPNKVKLKIVEKTIDNKVVKVLPKIWVQFIGLPKELCDFFIIWAVGSIFGITKDVDMVFTRKHDICRLQVLIFYLNLIPQFVDVVIGECMYTLQFCVEECVSEDEPEPMEMDDYPEDARQEEDSMHSGQEQNGHSTPTQSNKNNNSVMGSNNATQGSMGTKNKVFHIEVHNNLMQQHQDVLTRDVAHEGGGR
jgi:hypothetical protein